MLPFVEKNSYRCAWPECKAAFSRSDYLYNHIERDHQQGDEKKLQPVLAARQEEIFIFMVRKSVRGQGCKFVKFIGHLINAQVAIVMSGLWLLLMRLTVKLSFC